MELGIGKMAETNHFLSGRQAQGRIGKIQLQGFDMLFKGLCVKLTAAERGNVRPVVDDRYTVTVPQEYGLIVCDKEDGGLLLL